MVTKCCGEVNVFDGQQITRGYRAKAQMASEQGSRCHIESPTVFICVYTALLRNVSTLFLNIFSLLAVTQSVDNLFYSFIVLCKKNTS